MTHSVASRKEMNIPLAGETIAVVSNYRELIEAFRAIKARLGLSNEWCDYTCGRTDGHIDKVLGPSQIKTMGPILFSSFCQIFAVRFRMEIDLDAVTKMRDRWEKREEGKVAVPDRRISKRLIEKATPHVMSDFAKRGVEARLKVLTGEHRSRIAQKAAKARWSKPKIIELDIDAASTGR